MSYTVVDTEYWRETGNRLLVKTAYDYNNKSDIEAFPAKLNEWNSYDYKYPQTVYEKLNADILLSRAYTQGFGKIIWLDIINSKVGESFHKQKICVEGAGWTIVNESVARLSVGKMDYNPYLSLYANRLDLVKNNERQVMLYWFMFKKFESDNAVTMIRLSAPVATNYSDTFDVMNEFVEKQLFTAMYKEAGPTYTVAEKITKSYGTGGIIIIFTAILFPIALIFNQPLNKLFKNIRKK